MKQFFAFVLLCATMFTFSCEKEDGSIAIEKITLNKHSLTLEVGQRDTLTAMIFPSEIKNQSVRWHSSDSKVVSVNDAGIVIAEKISIAPAVITATSVADPTKTTSCTISVRAKKIAVTQVSLNKETLSLNVGDSYTLTATIAPENATNKAVTWKSSNAEAVSVSDLGVVKAQKGSDTPVIITATSSSDPSQTATCEVTTKAITITGISLDKTTLLMKVGRDQALVATITPEDATNKALIWSTSDAEVATVSDKGVVSAKKASQTPITITVTSVADPTKKATCQVTTEESGMIGNYYFEDGTISEKLDENKTCIGIVYWEDPNNAGHGLIVGLKERQNVGTWEDALDWAVAQTGGGLIWSCPNKEELQYLYCAYIGTTATIWDGNTKLEAETDPAAAALFNAAIFNAGGDPIDSNTAAKYYWSSIESDAKNAWYVNFKSGHMGVMSKTYVRVRPVASF